MSKQSDDKKGFILYKSYERQFQRLAPEQQGALIMAIFAFQRGEEPHDIDDVTAMAFDFIAAQMERDIQKWEETCQKRAEAGKLGGRPRKTQIADAQQGGANGFSEKQIKAKKANGFSEKQIDPDIDDGEDTETEDEEEELDFTRKEGKKENIDIQQHQGRNWDFPSMTDEDLLTWGETNNIFDSDVEEAFPAWQEECKKRKMKAGKWKGKIIKSESAFERLKSHDQIMREWQISPALRDTLKGFLRSCYVNKHLVTNEKLEGILLHLQEDYSSERERIEAVEKAVRGGYFDIKRYS